MYEEIRDLVVGDFNIHVRGSLVTSRRRYNIEGIIIIRLILVIIIGGTNSGLVRLGDG